MFFDAGGARVYCDAAAIRNCAATYNDESPKVNCCKFLDEGESLGNSVDVVALMMETFLVPLGIFGVAGLISVVKGKGSYTISHFRAEMNATTLGWTTGVFISSAIMGFFKRIVGFPRPNSFSLLALGEYDTATNQTNFESSTREAFTNFPSGHSSLITSSMIFVSFFLSAKVQSQIPFSAESKTQNGVRLLAVSLCYLPFFLAMYVSASRVLDYWHSPACVCAGMRP